MQDEQVVPEYPSAHVEQMVPLLHWLQYVLIWEQGLQVNGAEEDTKNPVRQEPQVDPEYPVAQTLQLVPFEH